MEIKCLGVAIAELSQNRTENPNNGFDIIFDSKYERNNFFSPEESLTSHF